MNKYYGPYTIGDIVALSINAVLFLLAVVANVAFGFGNALWIVVVGILTSAALAFPAWKRVWYGGVQKNNGQWEWFCDNKA